MNILLISQCNKNALKESRRIIDQFAERVGERSWQTHITEKGLEALHKLLRKTARKNTAVACHWIRSKNHTELLWIVGDKSQFNERGRVPTNRTNRNILRFNDECPQLSAADIQITAVLAGLLHDLGKASNHFQNKLQKNKILADQYRHEWWSVRLLQIMIADCKSDEDCLKRLADWESYRKKNPNWFKKLQAEPKQNERADRYDFSNFPPLLRVIAWLILSHHRMPIKYDKQNKELFQKQEKFTSIDEWFKNLIPTEYWIYNPKVEEMDYNIVSDPTTSEKWQKDLTRWANKALKRIEEKRFFAINEQGNLSQLLNDPLFLHLSRLCLIVGDHYFSSQKYNAKNQPKYQSSLWANSDKFRKNQPKQLLDEHLCGVANCAKNFARALLWTQTPFAYLEQSKSLEKPVKNEEKTKKFLWQNQACDLAETLQEDSIKYGFFGINSSSTGSGKTLANAKIMYALSKENNSRITIGLGLRVLTLQTGKMLKEELNLRDDEIATLIGSSAIKKLFDKDNNYGSESEEENYYLGEDENFDEIRYESAYSEELLSYLLSDNKIKTLLDTPIISCTIDHLMQISEQTKGGRFAAPMLRIFSSDIILDEPDDFSIDDLPALSRLVYWIGLLGGRLLLSSATLTPDLCEGLFRAYQDGRIIYNRHFGLENPENKICCAWFNEFDSCSKLCNKENYRKNHQEFIQNQIKNLEKQIVRRKAEILELEKAEPNYIAEKLIYAMQELHQRHSLNFADKKISIGLIRLANINPLQKIAQALLKSPVKLENTTIHLVCYHARQLLFLRSKLENTLDRLLNRKNPQSLFKEAEILEAIKNNSNKHHIFVVLGSPVCEVGRDHDYDWAIVEPSSLRSLIQLAGRVWRHRTEKIADFPNIKVFNKNLRNLKKITKTNEAFYLRPGFEKKDFYLLSENQKAKENSSLFAEDILNKIDARPRFNRPESFNLKKVNDALITPNLAELEHLVMAHLLNRVNSTNYISEYRNNEKVLHLTADSQKNSPFRYSFYDKIAYTALYDNENIIWRKSELILENLNDNRLFKFQTIHSENPQILKFLDYNYFETLKELSSQLYNCEIDELTEEQIFKISKKYAVVELNHYPNQQKEQSWIFDTWLGFLE